MVVVYLSNSSSIQRTVPLPLFDIDRPDFVAAIEAHTPTHDDAVYFFNTLIAI